MNELIRKIAISTAVFCGVVIIMSLAAVVLMHAGEAEVPYGGITGATADASRGDGTDQAAKDDAAAPVDSGNTGDKASDRADASTGTTPSGTEGGASGSGASEPGGDAGNDNVEAGAEGGKAGTEGNVDAVPDESDKQDVPAGNKHIIVIDAAHQSTNMNDKEPIGPGSDKTRVKISSGAEGVATGTPEYKLTLAVAQLLRDELNARGYDTIMIRETNDVTISDAERAQLANSRGEIIVHIHGNADEREGIKGIMAFCPTGDNSFVLKDIREKCKDLCSSILSELENATGAKNWGAIGNDNLTALNWTTIPAAHIEIGYLSNPDEDRLMQTDDYRRKIAQGIAEGIDKYFGE